MKKLSSGEFFGLTDYRIAANGLMLTNTKYTQEYVDWHHHENAYFTFIIYGRVTEGSKKGEIDLSAGDLLFHNAHDCHYNIKSKDETRGLHLEIDQHWMKELFPHSGLREGSFLLNHPKTKILFYKMLKESRMADDLSRLGIQHAAIQVMDSLGVVTAESHTKPSWVKKCSDFLQDSYVSPLDIKTIANELKIHPVHLSRSFAKYFGCTMAEYVRQIKVERALSLLLVSGNSLGSIAYQCGFADQSHMIRCFREMSGDTPSALRKMINSLTKR